ncbi:AAA family ATPase [Candidatus Micrarchaeota archaeon]|nr:AAA family ATPase [Candidatus Micrarchaeota archaeon]
MLQSIRLINWRSHADTYLQFHQGTNILVGIMGSGKSSVLEAISFAFFGTFPALERRKMKMEDIIRLNEPEAKIILEFTWNRINYKIERKITRKKSSHAEIYKNNALVESGPVAVTTYIENLISLDYDLFTRAIYSEQNNIDYFLTLDPRRRKQEIDSLLGLDKFELARTNIVAVIGRIRSKKEVMEERFNKDKLAELEAKEQKLSTELSTIESTFKSTIESYEKHNSESKTISSNVEEMRKNKELYEKWDREILRFSGQAESLEKDLEVKFDNTSYEKIKMQLNTLSEDGTKLSLSIKSFGEQQAILSKELGSLEASLKTGSEAKKHSEELKKTLADLLAGKTQQELLQHQQETEQTLLQTESDLKTLQHELTEAIDLMDKLKPGLSKCPLCSSNLAEAGISHIKSEKENLINQKKQLISELSKNSVDVKKQYEELKQKIQKISLFNEKLTSLEKDFCDLEKAESRKQQVESDLRALLEKKQGAENTLETMNKELEQLRSKITECENLLKKDKELKQLKQTLAGLKTKLTSIKFDPAVFEQLRQTLEDSKLKSERLLSQKKSTEEQLRVNKDMLTMMQTELSEIHNLAKNIQECSLLEEQLHIYKNALLETQTSLRRTLIDAINSAMNEIWPIFYPYRNYHALRLNASERDYIFEVNDSDWRPLEAMASGGERASAALTLRVALAMILTPKLSWLVLDEPTHNLDAEAIELLSHALQFKVPEVVKQTFVITHEEGLMGSEFASSYRLTRDKQYNGETKIEVA